MSDATARGGDNGLPKRRVTFNMLVGYNVTFFRRVLAETQAEFGAAMGGWSPASVSAAERSWEGRRVRKFDSDEIARIADHFGVPLLAMLLPPVDAGTAVDYVFDFGSDTPAGLADLLRSLSPPWSQQESLAMTAYRERLMALGEKAASIGYDPVAMEVLRRARSEADRMLTTARGQVTQVTDDAVTRAKALELDAQERHRAAMGSLVRSREELEKRVEDLRAFERDYRSRMVAYFEGMIRDLQSGAADSSVFPAVGQDPRQQAPQPPPDGAP
ncbi:MAG: hypothetical protein ACRDOK_19490 [Streptosporangiaceae bacterium]